jgi:hypothetical protein
MTWFPNINRLFCIHSDHITPRVVELLEPATVGWLKFDDWPRPSLERFIAKCDPTQLHTLKEILSPLVGPDGSIQRSCNDISRFHPNVFDVLTPVAKNSVR